MATKAREQAATKKSGARAKQKKANKDLMPSYECVELKIKGTALSITAQVDQPFKVNADLIGEECRTLIRCEWDGMQWVCT